MSRMSCSGFGVRDLWFVKRLLARAGTAENQNKTTRPSPLLGERVTAGGGRVRGPDRRGGKSGSSMGNHRDVIHSCRSTSRLFSLCLCVCVVIACRSKTISTSETLFPQSNEVPGWNKSGDTRTFPADKLWEYIDGDAERYIQAGVEKTLTADYRYADKSDAVADVYIMSAPEGAKKIFESEPAVGSAPAQLGEAGRLYKGSLVFWKGRYLVRLVAYEDAPEMTNALVALGHAIEGKL